MLYDELRVEHVVLEGVHLPADVEAVGHEGVPVVQMVELRGNPVLVLERLAEQELGSEQELVVVAAEVLDVVLYDDLDRLPCNCGQMEMWSCLL